MYACVRFLDEKTKNCYRPIHIIYYSKKDDDHIHPQNMDDFDPLHKYFVYWCNCPGEEYLTCTDTSQEYCMFYKAYIICLGENEDDVREKVKSMKRVKLPHEKYSPDNESPIYSQAMDNSQNSQHLNKREETNKKKKNKKRNVKLAKQASFKEQLNKYVKSKPPILSDSSDNESETNKQTKISKPIPPSLNDSDESDGIEDAEGAVTAKRKLVFPDDESANKSPRCSSNRIGENDSSEIILNREEELNGNMPVSSAPKGTHQSLDDPPDPSSSTSHPPPRIEGERNTSNGNFIATPERSDDPQSPSHAPQRKETLKASITYCRREENVEENLEEEDENLQYLIVTPDSGIDVDAANKMKYEIIDDNKIYLGEGKAIQKSFWEFLKRRGEWVFLRELCQIIWGKNVLVNRCVNPKKVTIVLQDRSPRKKLTPRKHKLVRELFSDFLDERGKPEEVKVRYLRMMNKHIGYKIKDLRNCMYSPA